MTITQEIIDWIDSHDEFEFGIIPNTNIALRCGEIQCEDCKLYYTYYNQRYCAKPEVMQFLIDTHQEPWLFL